MEFWPAGGVCKEKNVGVTGWGGCGKGKGKVTTQYRPKRRKTQINKEMNSQPRNTWWHQHIKFGTVVQNSP